MFRYFNRLLMVFCFLFPSSFVFANNPQIASEQVEAKVKETEQVPLVHVDSDQNHLNEIVIAQKEKIEELERKIESLDTSGGMNFAVWTGILLASVAIILTTLGVVMAIFSFLGYKKIMSSVHDIATNISGNVAKDVAQNIAENLTPGVTEKVLIKLFEDNKFDKVINHAVEVVVYRGIQFDDDDLVEESIE